MSNFDRSSKTLEEATTEELVEQLKTRTPCAVIGLVVETNSDSKTVMYSQGSLVGRVGIVEILRLAFLREAAIQISGQNP